MIRPLSSADTGPILFILYSSSSLRIPVYPRFFRMRVRHHTGSQRATSSRTLPGYRGLRKLVIDYLLRGADQLQRSRLDALWTLGGTTHHQYRLAEWQCLLLDSDGIRKDQVAVVHVVMEVQHIQRFNDSDPIIVTEAFVCCLPHHRNDGSESHGILTVAKLLS